MKTVSIFKTSVVKRKHIRRLRPFLNSILEDGGEWNFDLEDCDNILRVEAIRIAPIEISGILEQHGFRCEELH